MSQTTVLPPGCPDAPYRESGTGSTADSVWTRGMRLGKVKIAIAYNVEEHGETVGRVRRREPGAPTTGPMGAVLFNSL